MRTISGFLKLVGAAIVLMIVVGAVALAAKRGGDDAVAARHVNMQSHGTTCATDGRLELVSDACCKHCTKGKACGDSCIAASKTCTKAPGCACD